MMSASGSMRQVPIVDIAPYLAGTTAARDAIAHQVDQINREIGFLVVTGHGVDPALLTDWLSASRAFFQRPLAEKLECLPRVPGVHQGYHPMAGSRLAAKEGDETPPDLREYFMAGREDLIDPRFHHPNLWPASPARFAETGKSYFREMTRLSSLLMGIFARALGLPEDWFTDKIERHFSILSTIYYPPQASPPTPGQLRAGVHTDYGALTILATTDAPGGLQVRLRDGDWVDVPHVAGAYVINIGDMMQRWTNDRWLSNWHRVGNPPDGSGARERQSTAYFLHPDPEAVVSALPGCVKPGESPRHPPIRAGEYMLEREARIARPAAGT